MRLQRQQAAAANAAYANMRRNSCGQGLPSGAATAVSPLTRPADQFVIKAVVCDMGIYATGLVFADIFAGMTQSSMQKNFSYRNVQTLAHRLSTYQNPSSTGLVALFCSWIPHAEP
uniref:Uncharacterized protein n=1 Tax=Parascaris equorum TaxID=6256 RepID=A0A914S0X4_PAREQ